MRNKKSFSLIEMLVATSLIVVGIVSIVSVMSKGITADRSNDGSAVALRLAQQALENVENTPTTTYTYINSTYAATKATLAAPFSDYQREVLVTSPYTGMTQITANVYWNFKSNSFNMKVSLSTLIADTSVSSTAPQAASGSCGFGSSIGGGQCRGYITASGTWSVPADWTSTNKIECLGAGGNGQATVGPPNGGAGGEGGGYAAVSSLAGLSGSITVQVDTAGNQSSTYFSSTGTVNAKSGANGGSAARTTSGQTGSPVYAGGAGASYSNGGGGGGGAAGLNGAGAGAAAASGTTGGNGGNGDAGSGGAKGTGGAQNNSGNNGSPGTEWSASYGSGGGGGGCGLNSSGVAKVAGNGGTYGGGGGGAGFPASGASTRGTGGNGLIVITYTP